MRRRASSIIIHRLPPPFECWCARMRPCTCHRNRCTIDILATGNAPIPNLDNAATVGKFGCLRPRVAVLLMERLFGMVDPYKRKRSEVVLPVWPARTQKKSQKALDTSLPVE